MPAVYVTESGARVEKEYQRLLVTKDDEVLLSVPFQQVTLLVLVGAGVGVTTPALHALLAQGTPLWLVRRSGDLIGHLAPPVSANLTLRRAQYQRCVEPAFQLEVGRAILAAKLHNQRVLALRIARRDPQVVDEALATLRANEEALAAAPDSASLLGLEGSAAKAYFSVYRQAFSPDWHFDNRNRRPPRDPINALLSLGYTLLVNVLMAALESVGLDPYQGILHAEARNRPALALDLLEEFRAPLVDSLALALTRRRMIAPTDFETEPADPPGAEGVVLTPPALRIYLREFGDRLESQVKANGLTRPLSYRKLFEVQAHRLVQAIEGKKEYCPFLAR